MYKLIEDCEARVVWEPDKHERLRGMLWGMFVGDALAMPVHWYYDVAALQRDFGIVRDYQAPRESASQFDHVVGQHRGRRPWFPRG